MFTNVFFLMMMLILIALSSEEASPLVLSKRPFFAISLAVFLYLGTLKVIYWQNMRLGYRANQQKNNMSLLANMELGAFFIVYFFILRIQRFFLLENFIFATTLSALFALILYFGGLGVFNYVQNILRSGKSDAFYKTLLEVQFLIPFVLPFILFMVLNDLMVLMPWKYIEQVIGITGNSRGESIVFFAMGLLFMILMVAIMPLAVIHFWKCKELTDSPLKERLRALCEKAKFKCAGLKTWDVVQNSMTAAIIGVWSKFRYVMFTPTLLKKISPDAIQAILAHEIGHSKLKHLFIYPFIIFGILITGIIVTSELHVRFMLMLQLYFDLSTNTWTIIGSIMFFIIFLILLAILFRLIFGYFSRLFERQADLYIFKLGIPAGHLIEALDEIGIASGYIHDLPNWHHYSIRQRIDFLKKVENNSSLINTHHRKVLISLVLFFIFFGALMYFTFYD